MSAFGIDIFNFEFWYGPPPVVPTEKVVAHHRPGADGVSHQLLGRWGESFEVTVESHWSTIIDAMAGYNLMRQIIGTGPVSVKYANVNFTGLYGCGYVVEAVDMVELRAALLLSGPGYSYANGALLRTRFVLTPQEP